MNIDLKYTTHTSATYWVYLWSLNEISPVVAKILWGQENPTDKLVDRQTDRQTDPYIYTIQTVW